MGRHTTEYEAALNSSGGNRQPEKTKVECVSIGDETPSGAAIWVTVKSGLDGEPTKMCFPLSQVHEIARSKVEGQSYLMVTPWIASQKGLA